MENAQKELSLWFPEGLVDNVPVLRGQVGEDSLVHQAVNITLRDHGGS